MGRAGTGRTTKGPALLLMFVAAALASLAPLVLVACGDEAPAAPTGAASITGPVAAAIPAAGAATVAFFTIERGTGEYDAATVRVLDETAWYLQSGTTTERIETPVVDALLGKRVAVQFSGAVAESYPVQAGAAWVVVY